jgi:hypothetical protein
MSRNFTDVPLRQSAAAGFLSFAVGYAVLFVMTLGRVTAVLSEAVLAERFMEPKPLIEFFAQPPETWKVSAWLFYNAHFSPAQVPLPQYNRGTTEVSMMSILGQLDGIFTFAYAVPFVVLFAASAVIVYWEKPRSLTGALLTGGYVFVGYAPLAGIGTFLFVSQSVNGRFAPSMLQGIFVTGFAYPVAVGVIGGFVTFQYLKHVEDAVERRDIPLAD